MEAKFYCRGRGGEGGGSSEEESSATASIVRSNAMSSRTFSSSFDAMYRQSSGGMFR